MYESDPFAAYRAVKQRQDEAVKKKAALDAAAQPRVSKEFIDSPEVKMAASLRDTVEEAIRKVCRFRFPRTSSNEPPRHWHFMVTKQPQPRALTNPPPKH